MSYGEILKKKISKDYKLSAIEVAGIFPHIGMLGLKKAAIRLE